MEKVWYSFYDEGVPKSIQYPDLPLYDLLDRSGESYPENDALIFMGKRIKYRKLKELTDRFARALIDLGIERGDRVALFLPNCPQYVIAFYGTIKAGAIVVPNNPLLSGKELSYQIEDSGAKAIVTLNLKMLYHKVMEVKREVGIENVILSSLEKYLPFPKNVLFPLVKRREISKAGGDVLRFEKLLEVEAKTPEVKVDPGDVAAIFYTTGTTGKPKPVALTHRNLVINAVQCKEWFGVEEGKEIFLTPLPFFHTYALTTALNAPFLTGSTVIMTPTFNVKETLKLIARYKPNYFVGVPPVFEAINRYPETPKYDFSSIRFAVSGASPLSQETLSKFKELTGVDLIEGYGLTEASPVTHCNPRRGKRKGIGLPFPDTDCKIIDLKTGEELPPGREGELCIKGPQVMPGYWRREEETREVLKDGWLHTGDIARMDEEGYFEIVVRKKDLITVRLPEDMDGIHVYPEEIERVLIQHPKVKEAGVVGVPSPLGERIKAFVVKAGEVTAEEIMDFCRRNLAHYKVPEMIEFIEELPKNIMGKILRRELRERG
ncbi:long-chain fatty acid--CoA ligase [Candidatus Poribacteria bacterium]|nr:long-chain fatty acid--CoA ligase [Candidatus Poribacteria bacterium]